MKIRSSKGLARSGLRPRALRARRKRSRRASRVIGRSVGRARLRLRGYRYASMLAVALTGLLLLAFAPHEVVAPEEPAAAEPGPSETPAEIEELVPKTADEFQSAVDNLVGGLLFHLPKFVVAAIVLLAAYVVARMLRWLIRRFSKRWERGEAFGILVMFGFWLLASGIAVGILAGDLRALLGSLGLVGLALSWALQTPIESFTGWLLNSFKGYYRVGDRIAVGDVFGDVYRIDVLTTTVWEVGTPDRPGAHVNAEQPTGRLITFPNNEILTGTVVNLTRDFPYVWNELEVMLAAESDVEYAFTLLEKLSGMALQSHMQAPAARYAAILKVQGLDASVPERPQLYVSAKEDGVAITIRYLVHARQRRHMQSELTRRIMTELSHPGHAGRIVPYTARRLVEVVDARASGGSARPGGQSPGPA